MRAHTCARAHLHRGRPIDSNEVVDPLGGREAGLPLLVIAEQHAPFHPGIPLGTRVATLQLRADGQAMPGRREKALAVESARGEAAWGTRAGWHRTCEIAASRRGSTESSAPQKPIHDSRRPSAIDDFLFFWVREPSVARGRVKWIGPHFVPRSGPIYKPVRRGDYCFPVGRLCFTKWRQTPGIGTQVPQRSREGKTERTGRAQPR
jgi:hypothetical protein